MSQGRQNPRHAPPIDLHTFRFWYPWRVRYRDCDQQGIVYFSVYLEYVEQAVMEYFRACGVPIASSIRDGDFDWAVVHAEIDYHHPAAFDDQLAVGIRVSSCGRTSFHIDFVIVSQESRELLTHGRLVLVSYDSRAKQSRPIPLSVREAIEKFEGVQ